MSDARITAPPGYATRDGCNYFGREGEICYKCGKVHGLVTNKVLLDATRRNVQTIRNRARERRAEMGEAGDTPETCVERSCAVVLADIDMLERDIIGSRLNLGMGRDD